jgi:hypothetical protein
MSFFTRLRVTRRKLVRTLSVIASLITIFPMGYRQLRETPKTATTHSSPRMIAAASANPVINQRTRGDQSPNVSTVKGDVRIGYDSAAAGVPDGAPKKTLSVLYRGGSATQISEGMRSPNVNGVGGNVEISYGAPIAGGGVGQKK